MKRYPVYKDSDLPWVREIPEHWEISRGKNLFKRMSRSVRPIDEIVTAFRDGTVTLRKNRREEGFTNSLQEIGYQGIRKGDLVIHAMDGFAGAIGVSDSDGKGTPVYAVCVPRHDEHPAYYACLLRLMAQSGYIQALARGIRERSTEFRFDQFAHLSYPVPPRTEQDSIVSYLETKEQEIQKFISNKRRTIELLKERKTAAINSVLTCSLNPDVPIKPSNIPCLENIPEHWSAVRLKFVITPIEQGWSPQCDEGATPPDRWGVLKVGCVNSDNFNEQEIKTLPTDLTPIPELEIKHGDILVSRANTRELVGSAALVEKTRPKLLLCDKLFRFQARPDQASPKFLVLALRSLSSRRQIEVDATGASSSMQNIGQGTIKNLWIALPPLEEQQKIVKHVEGEQKFIGSTIAAAEHEIKLMEEYRAVLIDAAVTGKIDVRATAAKVIPFKRVTPEFKRAVLAAEIVHQLHTQARFGRVKLMKLLYLAGHHAKLPDMKSSPLRDAAGPFDNNMLRSVEKIMRADKWYLVVGKNGDAHRYVPLEKAGGHEKYFEDYWGEKREIIQWLIDLLRPMNKTQSEIVATVYAVWNDFLISGKNFTDDDIVNEVLTNWHDSKKEIEESRWRAALPWMREKGLEPTGFGTPTRHKKVASSKK
jgi:type I restriction enzyme S subunit